jgi:hypothetical protein
MLLFCIGSSMDRTKAGINDAVVTGVVVKGLADRDAAGTLEAVDLRRLRGLFSMSCRATNC